MKLNILKHQFRRLSWLNSNAVHQQAILALAVAGLVASLVLGTTSDSFGQSSPAPAALGMFGPDRRNVSAARRIQIYRALGVKWARINASFPNEAAGMTSPRDAATYRQDGLKILASVSYDPLRRGATSVANVHAYQAGLDTLIKQIRPTTIAIENEVDNAPYRTSADNYLRELSAGCAVAHSNGVQCIDSGLTAKRTILLAIDDALRRGDTDTARRLSAAAQLWFRNAPSAHAQVATIGRFLGSQNVASVRAIVSNARSAGADAINVHWYCVPDGGSLDQQNRWALATVAATLRRLSGLPLFGGEVGLVDHKRSDSRIAAGNWSDCISAVEASNISPVILWNPGAGAFATNPSARSLVDRSGGFLAAACPFLIDDRIKPNVCAGQ